jgi:hypothetical protein
MARTRLGERGSAMGGGDGLKWEWGSAWTGRPMSVDFTGLAIANERPESDAQEPRLARSGTIRMPERVT